MDLVDEVDVIAKSTPSIKSTLSLQYEVPLVKICRANGAAD